MAYKINVNKDTEEQCFSVLYVKIWRGFFARSVVKKHLSPLMTIQKAT